MADMPILGGLPNYYRVSQDLGCVAGKDGAAKLEVDLCLKVVCSGVVLIDPVRARDGTILCVRITGDVATGRGDAGSDGAAEQKRWARKLEFYLGKFAISLNKEAGGTAETRLCDKGNGKPDARV
ncbi:MAG: hypothetical protein ABIQ16_19680 [Polyangiaceae bacterium]